MKSVPDYQKMYQLAENYSEASRLLEEQSRDKTWGASGPKVLVDSFAVELYLKCLYVLDKNSAPRHGHDWEELFNALEPITKTLIRSQFEQSVQSHPVLSNLHLFNPEAVKTTDFNRSLKAAKDTFAKRRYLYESQSTDEWFYAHLLREAIRAVTRRYVQDAELSKKAKRTT